MHLRPYQAVVQRRGTILALYDITPELAGGEYASIGVNVMLPAKAQELWLDGKKIDAAGSVDLPCHDGSVVVVREGHAALAAKILGVEGLSGFAPKFELKNDAAKGNVVRLVAYAYQGDAKILTDKAVHAAVLLKTEKTPTDRAFEQFADKAWTANMRVVHDSDTWQTSVEGLDVGLDRGGHVVTRKADGVDVHITGPARINGHDLGQLLNVAPSR